MDFNKKLNQLVAHELAHGVNVYHHGEMENNNKLLMHGLRSGHLGCIMRYDNIDNFKEEFVGIIYCNGVNGTGKYLNSTYGDANYINDRGTCLKQFRVSGRSMTYPNRKIKKVIKSYVNEQKTLYLKRLKAIEKRIFTSIRAKGDLKDEKKKLREKVAEYRKKILAMENLNDVRDVKKEIDDFECYMMLKKLEKLVGS